MNEKLDYRYLKAFYYTGKYLNFSKASSQLNIAQSAVSRQVKLLEEGLGQQLVVRSSKKVILTSAGQNLLSSIEKFDQMINVLTEESGHQVIRVGILHGLLENWFLGVTETFYTSTKHELKIVMDTPEVLKEQLITNKLDIIFSTENIQNELISSLKIFTERLVLISKESVDLGNLSKYRWITYSENDHLMSIESKPSKQILTVASMTAVIELVERNMGIAIVPNHLLSANSKLQKYDLEKLDHCDIYMITHNYQKTPSYLLELVEAVTDSIPG